MPKKKTKKIRSWNAFVTEMNEKTGRKKRLTRRQVHALAKRRKEVAAGPKLSLPKTRKVRAMDHLQVLLNSAHWAYGQLINSKGAVSKVVARSAYRMAMNRLIECAVVAKKDAAAEVEVAVTQVN